MINAQIKDSREWGDTQVLLTVCPTGSFVPQDPFASSEALKLKCLEGQWLSPASLPSLSAA